MKKSVSTLVSYLIAAGLCLIGLGCVYYAFELVSVPHVREYSESWMIIFGLILAVVGAGWGVIQYRKAKQLPESHQATQS